MATAPQRGPGAPFLPPIGSPFIELQSVDSTNNYAREQIHAGLAHHGTAFFAHEQVAGKGQRGRAWTSEKGMNIAVSIVINPHPLEISQQFRLSACVAVAVQDFFQQYARDQVFIKWPNDLYWQDRKAGGILIESVIGASVQGEAQGTAWKWAIAGIGININQTVFPQHLPNPVSLKQITGRDFNPAILARELCEKIQLQYTALQQAGFASLLQRYQQLLYKRNEIVRFKINNRSFEGLVKGISESGDLIVLHGTEEHYRFGELEWLP